jgi:signal transduction histidine kinase
MAADNRSEMTLSQFIHDHHDDIIREFAIFARTLMPPGASMTDRELRDHAEELLTAIAVDMGTAQSVNEQSNKSMGWGTAQAMAASGELHADARMQHGFSLGSLLAEFRALRAAVLRLYEGSGASDLTEVRRFNESVDEALTVSITRYADRMEHLRHQFIGILGHDLRNPLGAITTGAALLAIPEDNPQRRLRVTSRILASAQRMQRMIGDLLDLAQARLGGAIPITRTSTDLQHVCEQVVLESQEAHPAVVLLFKHSGNLVGHWDADRLFQVISNLVGNAIQHGAGTLVALSADGSGDMVTLGVQNGGPPIPPDTMPFIFEPLARGASEGENAARSIGLGLFIARAIVVAHQGNITVTSSAEDGTIFRVRLPRSPARSTKH